MAETELYKELGILTKDRERWEKSIPYVSLVDDHGVDCIIKKEEGTYIEIQINARSNEVTFGDAALFTAITHEAIPNFFCILLRTLVIYVDSIF